MNLHFTATRQGDDFSIFGNGHLLGQLLDVYNWAPLFVPHKDAPRIDLPRGENTVRELLAIIRDELTPHIIGVPFNLEAKQGEGLSNHNGGYWDF